MHSEPQDAASSTHSSVPPSHSDRAHPETLTAAISLIAATASQELSAAARDDPKLYAGLPLFAAAMAAFLLLACITFYRVRRRGGRKAPPRLNFQELQQVPGGDF